MNDLEIVNMFAQIRSPRTSFRIDEHDLGILDRLLSQGVRTVIAETDSVFPRVLFPGGSNPIMVWDLSFWRLYALYVMKLGDLCAMAIHDGNIARDQVSTSDCVAPFAYFLALRVRDPDLAKAFAVYYAQYGGFASACVPGGTSNDMVHGAALSKMYLASHETLHVAYKCGFPNKVHMTADMRQRMDDVLWGLKHGIYLHGIPKEVLGELVAAYRSDEQFLEDMACDVYGYAMALEFERAHPARKHESLEEALAQVDLAVAEVNWFVQILTQLESFWKTQTVTQRKPITTRDAFEEGYCLRQELLPYFIGLDLGTSGHVGRLPDAPLQQERLAAGEILAQMIVEAFLLEDSYTRWAQIAEQVKYQPDDRFSLLQWKVWDASRQDAWDEVALVSSQRGPTGQQGRSHKVGRNEPCPCGSGKKYKKCCGRASGKI